MRLYQTDPEAIKETWEKNKSTVLTLMKEAVRRNQPMIFAFIDVKGQIITVVLGTAEQADHLIHRILEFFPRKDQMIIIENLYSRRILETPVTPEKEQEIIENSDENGAPG